GVAGDLLFEPSGVKPAAKPKASLRRPWIAEFRRAFAEGRFHDARTLFSECKTRSERADVVLLAARASMHADPAFSLRVLLEPGKRFVAEDAIVRALLMAEAYAT